MLLLDTHVFLWCLDDTGRLKAAVRDTIVSAPLVFVSAATIWEAQIKAALGKLKVPATLSANIAACGFNPLSVTVAHADAVSALPLLHKDPFDRLLLAQAREEKLTFVTHDRQLSGYDVSFLWT